MTTSRFATHEVFNQPHALVDYNLFSGNQGLQAALSFNAPGLDTGCLSELGAQLGSREMQSHARLANVHAPQLRSHDRFGRRHDLVEFHPSYHALMGSAIGAGLHGTAWSEIPSPSPSLHEGNESSNVAHRAPAAAHVSRAAGSSYIPWL